MSPIREKVAALVSGATRLPLLAVPLFVTVGVVGAGVAGLLWALLCLSLTSGLSLLYLFYLTRSGKVQDPYRIPRNERIGPLRAVAGLHAVAFVVVFLLGAPANLQAVLLSYALATALFALLALYVNLSLHTAGVSGASMCLFYVFGVWGVAALMLVPLVWWSRAVLKRHTAPELALGMLVGGGGTWLAFTLLS